MDPRAASCFALAAVSFATWLAAPVAHGEPPLDHFTTSEQCGVCHTGAPGATAMRSPAGEDVSPYATWQATMMANSFRDPYFRAQLKKESIAVGEQVQELCLRCHTPMLHHETVRAGDPPPRLADAVDDLYADDGVSCTVCHMIEGEGLGEASTFSGRPKFTDKRVIFGPFADPFPRPMQNLVRYTPTQGLHVRRSALCATCHTLVTEHHGTPFPEQTPYLEWRNSEFSDERDGADAEKTRTCQQCHMPATGATRIARNPMGFDFPRIPARADYRSHAFVGGNALMLDLLREHADELDVLAEPELLERMAAATRTQLAERTANVTISPLVVDGGVLSFSVTVENLTGHKFPTGYPARRAWLRVEVLDGDRTVFVSGDVDDAGRLVGIDDEMALPHVRTVEKAADVPVFEMVATDPDGAATTSLTRMVAKKKDNRLLPRGWRAGDPGIADIAPVGVDGDADFGAGGDTIACRIPVPADGGPFTVRATMLYQAVPPAWVDALREVDAEEARRFVRMYDAAPTRTETVAVATRDH